jgi:hypothetical protein
MLHGTTPENQRKVLSDNPAYGDYYILRHSILHPSYATDTVTGPVSAIGHSCPPYFPDGAFEKPIHVSRSRDCIIDGRIMVAGKRSAPSLLLTWSKP